MQDMQQKGRTRGNGGKTGESNRLAKLTWSAVAEIRISKAPSAELARKFGVSHKCVRLVRRGETWGEVIYG